MGLIDRIDGQPAGPRNQPSLHARKAQSNVAPLTAEQSLFAHIKQLVQDRIFQEIDPRNLDESNPAGLLTQISDAIELSLKRTCCSPTRTAKGSSH
jgi:hypothetical protein